MNKSLWAMLTETEKQLLLATEPDALAGLDEDDLVTTHDRVRRARNKYSKLYRRRAGAQVGKDRTRGRVHAANARTAAKAEIFEDALARVSRHLARAAAASAKQLKAERLEAARKSTPRPDRDGRRRQPPSNRRSVAPSKKLRTPARERASAQARASTRRAQAKRAGRAGRAGSQ